MKTRIARKNYLPQLAVIFSLAASTTATANQLSVCATGCAFETIQSAVNSAVSGDIINIAQGRYLENVKISGKSLRLVGAGNGRTVVDGGFHDSVLTLGTGTGTAYESIAISDLTVTHGFAAAGGGIRILAGAAVTLRGILVVSNQAQSNGAGIFINTPNGPTAQITGCAIDNNKVNDNTQVSYGGIAVMQNSSVAIDTSTITRNQVPLEGGGLSIMGGKATVTSSSIVDNSTTQKSFGSPGVIGAGGGIFFDSNSGALTVSKSDISRNSSAGFAGGIATLGAVTIADSVIARNTAAASGAGIFTGGVGQPLVLKRVYVIQNTATGSADSVGGIDNAGSPLQVVDSTIKDNVPINCVGTGCP